MEEKYQILEKRNPDSKNIDYTKIVKILLSRWYWTVSCIIIAIIITYIYLWYTPSSYSTSGSIKFVAKQNEIEGLITKSSFNDGTNLQSETYVIQSREVLLNAIRKIDYKVSFFIKGRVRTSETYPYKPFQIEVLKQDSIDFYNGVIDFVKIDENQFKLTWGGTSKEYKFNENITLKGILFKIHRTDVPQDIIYSFKFNYAEEFLGRVARELSMREAAKNSNVLLISLVDQNAVFASDFLNALMKEYISYDLSQKQISANQTIDFINKQLDFMNQQVYSSGSKVERFKENRSITSISNQTSILSDKLRELENKFSGKKYELIDVEALESLIRENKNTYNYNLNLEGDLSSMIATALDNFNQMLSQRQKLLKRFNENTVPVIQQDVEIEKVKNAIFNNINAYKKRIKNTINLLNKEIEQKKSELQLIPGMEREFVTLQSNYDIDKSVFELLSQKKLESQISRAAVVPSASIVEFAGVGSRLISPVPSKMYTFAILLGLITGVLLVVLVRLLNPYIYDKTTVESLTPTPIIGLIRKFPGIIDKNNTQTLSLTEPKSIFAESVRSVRTNLSFLASEQKSKVICVTSEISGEGKSFVSINLGSTLALIEKKVILVAADLRKSKIHKTFGVENKIGLSTYLSNKNQIDDIIQHSLHNGMDFITSGPVPPNPSELLHSKRMNVLLEHLRGKYDFVLIDTAPVGLVSDAIPLVRQADINAFIIRSGVSRFNSASIPERLSMEYHLKNVVIILNAFDNEMLHSSFYTSGYNDRGYAQYYYADYNGYGNNGYFENEEKRKWWNFWRKG